MRKQIQQFYFFAGFDEGENMLAELPVTLRLQLDLGALGERLAGEKAGAVHGGVSP